MSFVKCLLTVVLNNDNELSKICEHLYACSLTMHEDLSPSLYLVSLSSHTVSPL